MDQSCEKCGTPVPDGRPFCPECRAPQVRVEITPHASIPPSSAVLPEPVLADTPSDFPLATLNEIRIARSAVLKAGILGVLLGIIPLFGSVLTGVIAVWFYRRGGGGGHTAGVGARLGGAAAALAFAISAFFTAIQVFVLHAQKESEEAMLRVLGAIGANLADPEVQASIHRLFTPSGMIFSVVFGLIVSVALGAFGGAVATASRPRPRV